MIKKNNQTNKKTKNKNKTKQKEKKEKQNKTKTETKKKKKKEKERARSTDLRLTALFFTLLPSSFKMTAVEMASRTVFPPGP